eukprot:TRINITY_DN10052_c0_g3_i1.p1 TRINITY_DN10052_c0_g3~~TRINITY_DN10052_c0_g3_i1.p1  ORF type:complete len:685 (-),score=119.55 TRINITY_DN10052_c0_g3_i1:296-2350(-)
MEVVELPDETLAYGGEEDTILVRGDQLHVKVCGRTCSVDMAASHSLIDLQRAVQRALQMEGQDFQFCTCAGTPLATDLALREAVRAGLTPLMASLTDASIHYIENRREELAQMQWKLVREKMQGCQMEVGAVSRQYSDLQRQVVIQQNETQAYIDQTKDGFMRALEQDRHGHEASFRQANERITATAHLVNGEQNKRELVVQSLEKQIQEIRSLIDADRSNRKTEMETIMKLLKEADLTADAQRRAREALEQKQVRDVELLKDEMQASGQTFSELLQDQVDSFKRSVEDVNMKLQQADARNQVKFQGFEVDATNTGKRFMELESWAAKLEANAAQASNFISDRFEQMMEKVEITTQLAESVRVSQNQAQRSLGILTDRIKETESSMANLEERLHDAVAKESGALNEEMRRTKLLIKNDSMRQITEVEHRIVERVLQVHGAQLRSDLTNLLSEQETVIDPDTPSGASVPGAFQAANHQIQSFGAPRSGSPVRGFQPPPRAGNGGSVDWQKRVSSPAITSKPPGMQTSASFSTLTGPPRGDHSPSRARANTAALPVRALVNQQSVLSSSGSQSALGFSTPRSSSGTANTPIPPSAVPVQRGSSVTLAQAMERRPAGSYSSLPTAQIVGGLQPATPVNSQTYPRMPRSASIGLSQGNGSMVVPVGMPGAVASAVQVQVAGPRKQTAT